MNRTDRLLAIMLELQARRYTRAESLARYFELSVRTIYRDVQALCEAGVPIVATPGRGYTLSPGYFLPPLMLTPDEAGGLLLGAAFVAEQVDAPYGAAVRMARKKVEKLLPEATRRELETVLDSMRFVGRVGPIDPRTGALMEVVRRATLERAVLRLTYHARHGEPARRDVEPHALVSIGGRWLLAAWCRTRAAMRHFRLDRIDAAVPLDEHFTRRPDFTVQQPPSMERGPDEARVLFTHETLRWARESHPISLVREEPHPQGSVMVLRPHALRDLVPWLLSWGAGACVLEPPDLRAAVAAAARATAALYAAAGDGGGPDMAPEPRPVGVGAEWA